jgi:hypothetical protein
MLPQVKVLPKSPEQEARSQVARGGVCQTANEQRRATNGERPVFADD